MKRFNILVAACALLLASACNREVEFQHETFVSLNSISYSVDETVGTVTVPVTIYNPTGAEVQVTVATTDINAESGVDYEIVSPASGLLTFSGEETTKNIEVAITDYTGEFTGSKDFKLQIACTTPGVTVGSFNTASFVIKDLDHPLSMFIGEWAGAPLIDYFYGDQYALNLTIVANDEDPTFSTLYIQNLDPYFASNGINAANSCNIFLAQVTEDKKQLIIQSGQPVGYKTCQLIGFDGPNLDTASTTGYLIFDFNADGTLTIPNAFGVYNAGEGWYSAYLGGLTLSKK